jgi:hypothetical protein
MVEETEQEGTMRREVAMGTGKSVRVRTELWEKGKTVSGSGTNDGLMDTYEVRDSESIGFGILRWLSALTA